MPSMSYCMVENTALEFDQILNTINGDYDGNMTAWYADLSAWEKEAFVSLVRMAKDFTEMADAMDDEDMDDEDEMEMSPWE